MHRPIDLKVEVGECEGVKNASGSQKVNNVMASSVSCWDHETEEEGKFSITGMGERGLEGWGLEGWMVSCVGAQGRSHLQEKGCWGGGWDTNPG